MSKSISMGMCSSQGLVINIKDVTLTTINGNGIGVRLENDGNGIRVRLEKSKSYRRLGPAALDTPM